MEYVCLITQLLFLLITLMPTGHVHLVRSDKALKTYVRVETVVQTLLIACNVVLLFVAKTAMIWIVALHLISATIIMLLCEALAKKHCIQQLKQKIQEEALSTCNPLEIRRCLLEKHGLVFSVKEIENCLKTMGY